MGKVKLNLNRTVLVRLTDVGRRVRDLYYARLSMPVPPLKVDADGYTPMTLWQVAQMFGSAMYTGGDVPVETEVFVEGVAKDAAGVEVPNVTEIAGW